MRGTAADTTHYGPNFYAGQEGGSRSSARVVLQALARLLPVRSVLDVGCGTGTWLAEWREMGVLDTVGVDGDYVDRASLQVPPDTFRPADLTLPLDLGRRFDLVECLEVAEHLDAQYADVLVASLARHGDVLLFSAAIPGQGGTHHVNEQWPSYWVEKLSSAGFELFDVLRPAVWKDARAESWYRQNALILARGEAAERLRAQALTAMPVLDVVHPDLFSRPPAARKSRYERYGRKAIPAPVRSAVKALLKR